MSKRVGLIGIVLLALLLMVAPVLGQEATAVAPIIVEDGATLVIDTSPALPVEVTETLPTRDETLITTFIIVLAILAVFLLATLLAVFLLAYNAMPPWAQSLVLSNRGWIEARVDSGTDALVDLSKTTKNTLDDGVAKHLDELVDRKVKEWFDAREAVKPLRE